MNRYFANDVIYNADDYYHDPIIPRSRSRTRNYRMENRLVWYQHIGNKLIGNCWICRNQIGYDSFTTNNNNDVTRKRPICCSCKKLSPIDCSIFTLTNIQISEYSKTLYGFLLYFILAFGIFAFTNKEYIDLYISNEYLWLVEWITRPMLLQIMYLIYLHHRNYLFDLCLNQIYL